ncbi:MAG: glycosyltransferase [Anaerolineaceae bacterium]|nr:glycosyltransferase [Anaerolineaceae bacterium]
MNEIDGYNDFMSNNSLSICLIVKNEEQYLESCLSSIFGKVDEIIIVDTGSTDRTLEIARQYSNKVFNIAWPNDFSIARNVSLEKANGDWILVLDADETIDADQLLKLYDLINQTNADAFQVTIRNILPADQLIQYTDQYTLRLFRNRIAYRFSGSIHETLEPSISASDGIINSSDLVITHHGYAHFISQGDTNRGQRNLKMLQESLLMRPTDAYIHYQLGITYKYLNDASPVYKHLKKALAYNHKDLSNQIQSEIFMKLAQLAELENQSRKCIKYALSSIKLNPDNIISKYLLATNYIETNKFKEAYPHLLEIQKFPGIAPKEQNDLNILIQYCRSKLAP